MTTVYHDIPMYDPKVKPNDKVLQNLVGGQYFEIDNDIDSYCHYMRLDDSTVRTFGVNVVDDEGMFGFLDWDTKVCTIIPTFTQSMTKN